MVYMRKVIFATEYFDENQNSTGYLWSKIISKIKSDGFDVLVIPSGPHVEKYFFGLNQNLLAKFFHQIKISLRLALGVILLKSKSNLLFTGTNPTVFLCLLPLLKLFFDFKWVLLVHDVFPENLVAARLIKNNNIIFKLISRYFSWVYSSADTLLCIGRDMQALLNNKTNGEVRTEFVPNWVSADDVYPLNKSDFDFFKDNDWVNCVVFQFFGNIGRVQGIDNILNAISLITVKNAAFVFIGDGVMAPNIRKYMKDNPGKNIRFLGPMPLEQKNKGLALCDVALVSLEAGMLGLGVPSKTYFSLAAGKPILASVDSDSEIGLMLRDFPVGWRCDSSSPRELAKLIDEICLSPSDILKMKPREVFLENYSEDIVLRKISTIIRGVVENGR
jgi:hypothetical protein